MDPRTKLIEEDEYSIARRDEMYARKRPELLKLVEKFYRAFSSLAEKYDDAVREPLQAHRATVEAFPNQVSFLFAEEASSSSEPQTPYTQFPIQNEMFQLGAEGIMNVHKEEDQELSLAQDLAQLSKENNHLHTKILEESARAHKVEIELQTLQQIINKTEGERDAVSIQYQQISKRLSNVMRDIVPAQKYTREVEEYAKLLNEEYGRAKNELEILKKEILELNQEREHMASQYNQCMEITYNQQNELREAQEQATWLSNVIRWGYAKLVGSEERCVTLERVNQSLLSEIDNIARKLAIKDEQLSKKQANLENLQNHIQDQRYSFVQIEGNLRMLLSLHALSQEERKAIALELRNGFQMIKDLEMCKKDTEVKKGKLGHENEILNNLPLPSWDVNSKRKNGQPDDQILQCWKIDKWGYHSNLMDKKTEEQASVSVVDDNLYHELNIREQNNMNTISESLTKEGLGLDKMVVSKKCSNSDEEQKLANILDRFALDAQGLMSLQVLVQQMRTELETFKKRKIGKDVEYDKLQDQLQDVENSVMQLLSINTKLIETTENHPLTIDVITSPELDKIGKVPRRIVLNNVRRGFEKIERLKLEIQKIQYALRKLRDEKKSKGRCRFSLIRMGILLRDFVCSSKQQAFVTA
ncbi:hypothetical protein Nepgr_029426 [Nepenthes gracilis]|uniref:NAB domain-containing protein n=1 Tax=Nepenthes gracilis TaxID=150966 RepID=A0AAD3Y392_NEPGR|nr:hypothetical protein Nepgr_029426 [Nepenthes gracilis]